jgi:hypothetical protein
MMMFYCYLLLTKAFLEMTVPMYLQNCLKDFDAVFLMGRLKASFFLLPLSLSVGSVQHVFHHVVINIRQLFLRPAACLTSPLLETGVGANDCKCNRDVLNVPSEARIDLRLRGRFICI